MQYAKALGPIEIPSGSMISSLNTEYVDLIVMHFLLIKCHLSEIKKYLDHFQSYIDKIDFKEVILFLVTLISNILTPRLSCFVISIY